MDAAIPDDIVTVLHEVFGAVVIGGRHQIDILLILLPIRLTGISIFKDILSPTYLLPLSIRLILTRHQILRVIILRILLSRLLATIAPPAATASSLIPRATYLLFLYAPLLCANMLYDLLAHFQTLEAFVHGGASLDSGAAAGLLACRRPVVLLCGKLRNRTEWKGSLRIRSSWCSGMSREHNVRKCRFPEGRSNLS